MPHPCTSGPDGKPCKTFIGPDVPWGPDNCILCYKFATSEKHRKAWSDDEVANADPSKWPAAARLAAKLRRPEDKGLGDTVARNLKWLGADTLASWYKKITGADCGCGDRQQRLNQLYPYATQAFSPGGPDRGEPPKKGVIKVEHPGRIRHLLYHLYPCKLFDGGKGWRWNLDQLKNRLSLFNGHRIMAVATDENSDSIDEVKAWLAGCSFEFIEAENDPALREVVTFEPLFSALVEKVGSEDAILYAHGKGVTNFTWAESTTLRWAELLYETSFDYWPLVERRLKKHAVAGSLKRLGRFWHDYESIVGDWHYSGSFFWIRGDVLQKPDWKRIDKFWGGIETWPSLHVHQDDAGVLFHNFTGAGPAAYLKEYWDNTLTPAYDDWKIDHAADRLEPHLITCILVSHNKPKLVREAVESVKAQTTDRWQLIVMDSGPLSKELAQEYGNDSRITVLKSIDGTRCQGWQINRTYSYTKGDLVCYLADDDIYDPEAFNSFLKAAREHPDWEAWYGPLNRIDIRNEIPVMLSVLKADVIGGAGGEKLRGKADGMQICHRSTVRCSWPEEESLEARRYADGIFLDSIPVPIHPIPEKIGWHRFTKESMHDQLVSEV